MRYLAAGGKDGWRLEATDCTHAHTHTHAARAGRTQELLCSTSGGSSAAFPGLLLGSARRAAAAGRPGRQVVHRYSLMSLHSVLGSQRPLLYLPLCSVSRFSLSLRRPRWSERQAEGGRDGGRRGEGGGWSGVGPGRRTTNLPHRHHYY